MSDPENIVNAPWNMAQIYYIELSRLFRFKENAYLSNDIYGWNKGLISIYRRLYFKLNSEEREEFKKRFEKIKNYFKMLGNDSQGDALIMERVSFELDELDVRTMEIMDKYKMIFPSMEIKTLGDFEEKLGIKDIEV